MSTRAQQAQLLDSVIFQAQVKGALLAAAAQVIQEPASAPSHAHRLSWANAIYTNPQAQMLFFLPGTLTNPTVAASAGNAPGESGTPIDDNAMDYVVASLFDSYAAQYAAQLTSGAALQLGS